MNRFIFGLVAILLVLPSVGYCKDGWQSYYGITSNYFEGFGQDHRVVLTMDTSFHDCGWNSAANLRLSAVGPEAFSTYTSVILSAWLAGKKLSLGISGCDGDRAKIVAVRIGK